MLTAARRYLQKYCPKIVTIALLKWSRSLQCGALLEEKLIYRDRVKEISACALRNGP